MDAMRNTSASTVCVKVCHAIHPEQPLGGNMWGVILNFPQSKKYDEWGGNKLASQLISEYYAQTVPVRYVC